MHKPIHILPYGPEAIWLLKASLGFEDSTDPVDTSAQAALAPHQTTEQKKSADNFHGNVTCSSVHIELFN
jgi:hypothetical protein